ncbi:gliding motility-associated C-terminal domain-containing protein [Chitinophagaceae bacterium DXS]|nr:gliding motility-associated C-terminal domain-containing protein [Chitinophagaceae bacterium DXS]
MTPVCEGSDQLLTATSTTAGVTYNWSGPTPLVVNNDKATIKAATVASNGSYSVSATLNTCTSKSATVDVAINPMPVVPTIAMIPVCEGSDQLLTATSTTTGVTYNWSGPKPLVVNNNKATITAATVASNGSYSVSATLNTCTSKSATVNVAINPMPVVPTIAMTPVCEGSDQLLTATSTTTGVTYNWSGPKPLVVNNDKATIKAVTVAANGIYSVSATLNTCTSQSATVNVQIKPMPIVPTIAMTPVCEGSDQLLTATSTTTGVTYNWSGPKPLVVNNDKATIKTVTVAANGIYSVSATLNTCTSQSATVNVQIKPMPVVPTIVMIPVCEGSDQLLTATSTTTGVTYNWSGPKPLVVNNDKATITAATVAANGIYSVSATLNTCTSQSATVNVQIKPMPIVPTIAMIPVCEGSDQLLIATSTTTGVTYNWSGPKPLVVNNNKATITAATVAANGIYSVSATLNTCTSQPATVNVQIKPMPVVPTIAMTPVCEGSDQLLTATSTTTGVTYNWSGPKPLVVNNDKATITEATVASNGIYSVSATLNTCTSQSVTVNVQIKPMPAMPTIAWLPVCEGSDLDMTASTNIPGATFSWTGVNNFTARGATATLPQATRKDNGTYNVTATLNGCPSLVASTSVTLKNVPAKPTVDWIAVCEGNDLSMKASTDLSGVSFAWTGVNGFTAAGATATLTKATRNNNGIYSVTATLNGCPSLAGSTSVTLKNVPVKPSITWASICEGKDLTLLAKTDLAGVDFSWTGVNSFTANGSTAVVPAATRNNNGVYSVTASLNGCPSAPGSTTVTVRNTPKAPSISVPSICEGSDLTLSATTDLANSVFDWTSAGNFSAKGASVTFAKATIKNNGDYSVTATLNGCPSKPATATVAIRVMPLVPTVAWNTGLCEGTDLKLSAATTTAGTIAYAWSGPASYSSSTQNPTIANATVKANGTYSVTATLNGCTSQPATTNVTIKVMPVIPTVAWNSGLCEASDLKLSASTTTPGIIGYNWTGPLSFTSNIQNPVITNSTIKNNGTYAVTATLNGCTSKPATATVAVKVMPVVPTVAWNNGLCEGTDLQLSAATTTPGVISYAWSGPASYSSNVQKPVIAAATVKNNGSYSVTATLNGCTSKPGTTTVAVKVMPLVPTVAWNSGVCEDSDLKLSASTTTAGVIGYNWTGPLSFASNVQNPVITNSTIKNNGTYAVTATLNGCTSKPATTTVAVKVMPVVPTVAWNNGLCEGTDLQLSAATTTPGVISYAWSGPASYSSNVQKPVIAAATVKNNGSYSVTATLNGCTSKPATTTVAVKVMPQVPTVAWNNGVCEDSDLKLSASTTTAGVIGYNWTGPLSFASAVQNPVITNSTIKNNGTYAVTATLNGCTSKPATATVAVKVMPEVPTVAWNNGLCEGTDLQLSAASTTEGNISYAWSGPANYSSTLQKPVITGATVKNNGDYSVTATLNGCTSQPAITTIGVKVMPQVPTVAWNNGLCEGNDLTLHAATSTTGSIVYSWSGPSGFTSAKQDPVISAATIKDNGNYNVTASLNGCTSLPAVTAVAIKVTPLAPVITWNYPVCEGSDLQLNASTSTQGAIKYNWNGPSNYSVADVQNPLIASATAAGQTGKYTVVAVLDGCSSAPAVSDIVVKVMPKVPVIKWNDPLCEGNDLLLSATSNTQGNILYSWTGPSGYSSLVQQPVIKNASYAANTGAYAVTATLNGCTSAPAATVVSVKEVPKIPLIQSVGPLCEGTDLQLTATSSIVSDGTIQYNWTGPSGYTSNVQNPLIAAASSVTNTGDYTVSATLDGCTSASSTINVLVKLRPAKPAIQANDPLCEGSDLQLKAETETAGAIRYSWAGPAAFKSSKQGFTIQSVSLSENAGMYAVTAVLDGCVSEPATRNIIVKVVPAAPSITSNAPLCFGTDLLMNASTVTPGNVTYSWTGPDGFTSNEANPSVAKVDLDAAGVYHVAATLDGCTSAAADLRVVVNSLPAPPSVRNPSAVCAGGGSIQLADYITSGQNVTWFTDAQVLIGATAPTLTRENAGNFVYYAANNSPQNCRSELVKVTSVVHENPSATARKKDVSCLGGSDGRVDLVVSGGQFPYRFKWSNGSNERSLVNVSSGVYNAMVTDTRGCNARSSDAVVNDGVNPPAPIARSIDLCESGGTVMLSAKGASGTNLQWYTYEGTPLSSAPYIDKGGPASYAYYVSSRSALGCESEKTFVSAMVRSAPKITTINKHEPDCNGYEKGYFDVVADGGCNNSAYTFKLLNTMQEQSTGMFNNVAPGTYKVQVSDECGCSTTQDVELGITMNDCDVLMPTGFTPNGDKNNDVFRPAAYGKISDYKLQIYNRWGQLLFESEVPGKGWDGTYGGKDQPVATYVWQMFYKNAQGESRYKKGTIVLIR